MAVQISPARPSEEYNGLEAIHDALMKPSPEPVVAVVVIERTKQVFVDSDAEDYPVVRFSRIEPILSAEDQIAATEILERAASARGQAALDFGGDE